MPIWTDHAIRRAAERFPDTELEVLDNRVSRSKRPAKNEKKEIKAQCPKSFPEWHEGGAYKGRYVVVHRKTGTVFVMASWPETVITLFRLKI